METPSQTVQQPSPSGLPDVMALFTSSWNLFKKKMRAFMRLSVYAFVLQFALSIIAILLGFTAVGGALGIASGSKTIGGTVVGVSILLLIALVVVYLLLYAWIQGAFIIMAKRDEAEPQVQSVITEAKPLIMPIWWASILVGLVVIVGFILLIVPGIIFAVWFSFTTMIVVLEGLRGKAALQKSKSYVQGRWWPVLGRIVLLGLAAGIASSVASWIFGIFGHYVSTLLNDAFTAFVILPFAISYQYLLYRSVASTRVAPAQPQTPQ